MKPSQHPDHVQPNFRYQLVDKTGYEQGDSHGRKLIIPADPKKKAVLTGERWNFCTLNAENVQQI
jgi:hypothetical protein